MSKHHHKSKAEQIDNKARGAEPFHYEKTPQESKSIMSGNSQMKENGDGSDIQTLAYQIYEEKGGSAFDNWLEAERILGINVQTFSFMDKRNPDTRNNTLIKPVL